MHRRFLLISFTFLLLSFMHSSCSYGQIPTGTKNKKAEKAFNQGMDAYRMQDIDKALASFKEAVEKDPNYIEAWMMLGDLEGMKNNNAEAVKLYEKVMAINAEYPDAYYYAALTAFDAADYNTAKKHIDKYLTFKGITTDRLMICRKVKLNSEFAIEAVKNPVPFQPINLGPEINTKNKDYFPNITVDGQKLIFDRNINNNEDFYIATKKGDGWGNVVNPGAPVNSEGNESYPSFTADGKYVFFVRQTNIPGSNMDLYFSSFDGNVWGNPTPLLNVNSKFWESQPSISADGRTLYFLSSRPGGQGGIDIWRSDYSNGAWSAPVNLGPEINTPGDEQAPFLHPDGVTMYFASDGHVGMGKMDLYITRMDAKGQWGTPQNMGYPINTAEDERSLMVTADGEMGYLTSGNLNGLGDWDIYSFVMPEGKKPVTTTYVKGIVYDAKTKAPLKGRVELIDLSTGQLAYLSYSNKNTGEMMACIKTGVNYAFNVSSDGYLFFSENYQFNQTGSSLKPLRQEIPLKKINVGDSIVLKNVFFETAKWDLKKESNIELDKLVDFLKKNPKLKVEIGGHTDNVGKKEDNLLLSKNRAEAVFKYIVSKGIESSRLSFKGYGDTRPTADNKTEEGRKLNRRTEVKIVGMQ